MTQSEAEAEGPSLCRGKLQTFFYLRKQFISILSYPTTKVFYLEILMTNN